MDAREIRNFNIENCTTPERIAAFQAEMLQEIAAQFAEMNITLQIIKITIENHR